jgi:hypothetical protein
VVNVAGERTLENSAQVPPVLPHPLAVWPQASDLISLISASSLVRWSCDSSLLEFLWDEMSYQV